MARFLYTFFLLLLQPLVILRLLYKSLKLASYRGRLWERYGFNLPPCRDVVWVHAVSVGETITAKPLIEALLAQGERLLVTTTTPTGAEQVQRLFGDRVTHRFLPQDLPWCLRRLIRAVAPKKLLIMETELWPNLLHETYRAQVPSLLVNGRLSEKSAQGYQRFSALTSPMLAKLTHLAVQTVVEKQRFEALGVLPQQCTVVPSLKFDAEVPADTQRVAQQWRRDYGWSQRFIWVAASTHEPEETLALRVHKQLLEQVPSAVLILVPRHPDRFEAVAQQVQQSGLSNARFSQAPPTGETRVWLGDVMGQMWNFFAASDVAFIGNSLNGGGGHNVMEPALSDTAIVTGPAMFNFTDVTQQLTDANALTLIETEAEWLDALLAFAASDTRRQQVAATAKQVALRNGGGLASTLALVEQLV